MSDLLLASIDKVIAAADGLTRVCARHSAIADAMATENPVVVALKRSFQAGAVTPNDMLSTLGKMK